MNHLARTVCITLSSLILVVDAGAFAADDLLSHELAWKGDPPLSDEPILAGLSLSEFNAATKFPRFTFAGTVGDAVHHLMEESVHFSPDKFHQVGGFVIEGNGLLSRPVKIDAIDLNALELINEICRQADCRWTFRPSNILLSLPGDPE